MSPHMSDLIAHGRRAMTPRFEHFKNAARWLMGAFVAVTCYANWGPELPDYVDTVTRTDTVYVEAKQIEAKEPDAKVGKIESLAMPKVREEYVAVARGGAQETANAFCSATIGIRPDTQVYNPAGLPRVDTVTRASDSSAPSAPILVRSIREESRLFPWQRSSLYAVGVSGNGDLSERRYRVRQGAQLRADGDSLVVQHPRFPVKPIVGSLLLVGAGYLIGQAF